MVRGVLAVLAGLLVVHLPAWAGSPKFVTEPAARVEGNRCVIAFEASEPTDVVVEIVRDGGDVVRHLAAGMLGPNAPEPLAPDSLSQSIAWDRTDDDGRPVAGPVRVRVGLGMQPRFAGEYGGGREPIAGMPVNGADIERLSAITIGPDGTVYMLGGFFHPHTDRSPHLIALDAAGKYQREVYPPPAKLLAEKTPGMPTLKLADGSVIPQVQGWWDLYIPAMVSAANMVATPDGHLLLAAVAPDYVTERRALLKIGVDGAIPADAYRLRLPPGMHTDSMAMVASPDSKFLYVSGMATVRPTTILHVVYRLALDGSNDFKVFFGEEKKSGADDTHLNGPAGVAVDANGNVYVVDRGNGRVVVLKPDGSLLRQFKADTPLSVRVGKDGSAYVLSAKPVSYGGWVHKKLTRFSSDGAETGSVPVAANCRFEGGPVEARYAGFVLAEREGQVTLWIGCTSFPDGCNGYPFGYSFGIVKVVDDGKTLGKAEFLDLSAEAFAARVKRRASAPPATQRDGYRYGYKMKSNSDSAVTFMTRVDAKGKDVPFPAAGESKWVPMLGRTSARFFGRGLVRYDNNILFSYYNWLGNDDKRKYGATCIDLIAADGAIMKRELVYGLHEGTFSSSLMVDRKGNMYVADHIQPPGRRAPTEIEAAFPPGKLPGIFGNSYGSVFKIAAAGGGFNWGVKPTTQPVVVGDLVRQPTLVQDVGGEGGPRLAAVAGVQWQFLGGSPLPRTEGRCICTGTGFAIDPYARVFIPDAYRMCVHALDTNGNYLARIGRYGNQDDAKGAIAFARPRAVSADRSRLTVTDPQNGKATLIDLAYSIERTLSVPAK